MAVVLRACVCVCVSILLNTRVHVHTHTDAIPRHVFSSIYFWDIINSVFAGVDHTDSRCPLPLVHS